MTLCSRRRFRAAALAVPLLVAATAAAAPEAPGWRVPAEVRKLPNGLTVVVSEDHSAPTFGLCIAFRVGFRLEPKGRSGFAHLFEHLMYQGTPNAPKGIYDRVIEGGGGINNGSTRDDYTSYVVTAPVSALEPVLWLEADRMKALDLSAKNVGNQRDVVKEEIRVNVLNKPYGAFYWTDLQAAAFEKWENAHDGYGSFADLEAATPADAQAFFDAYYGPNNAVLVLVGDVAPADAFAKVEKYFGALPPREVPPRPDVSEPPNTKERTLSQADPLANVPALAVGWKLPPRGTRDDVPLAVLGELLAGGDASRLYLGLVKGRELLLEVQGGVGWPIGSPWSYEGPTLLALLGLYKPDTTAAEVVSAIDAELARLVKQGVPPAELERTKTRMVSQLYDALEMPLERAEALAVAQLVSGDAAAVNDVPRKISAVTSADVARAAATWLTAPNRVVIDRRPAPPESKPGAPAEGTAGK